MKEKTEEHKTAGLRLIYILRFIVSGALWIVYGILDFFDDKSLLLKIFSSILMLLSIVVIVTSFFVKQEREDSMSREHFVKACSLVLGIILFIIMVFTCLSAFIGLPDIVFRMAASFLIGGILLLIGIIWLIYERPSCSADEE